MVGASIARPLVDIDLLYGRPVVAPTDGCPYDINSIATVIPSEAEGSAANIGCEDSSIPLRSTRNDRYFILSES